ncbi:MAG: family 16 glycosylhydrolase [Staphylothermus sp.]|nr:family 16 glycosylhydrolase [Staphylothermus sp.]
MSYNPIERTIPGKDSIRKSDTPITDKVFDDFNEKTSYWNYRTDNYAWIKIGDSIARLIMGPTEALYYSNAEISDGDFNNLKWIRKNLEFKARLLSEHYGSAGWGFWNYSMVIKESISIWFIYLRSRSQKYPLNGFYVQVGNIFTPIKYFGEPPLIVKMGMRLFKGLLPIKFTTLKPVIPDLDLSKWHKYTILWKDNSLEFYIDENLVSEIKEPQSKYRYRIDAWIDNAVFTPLKDDYARVYRHITHENRKENTLEIDYIKLW